MQGRLKRKLNLVKRPLLAAMLLFGVPTVGLAQDGSEAVEKRTVEGAQKFLEGHFSRGGWEATSFSWFDGKLHHFYKNGWHTSPERAEGMGARDPVYGDIAAAGSPAKCITKLTVSVRYKSRIAIEEPLIPIVPGQVTAVIDWRNVNPIKVAPVKMPSTARGGEWVPIGMHSFSVWNPKTKSGVIFANGEQSVAERAAFAAQYLAEQCSNASNEGF